MQAEEAQGRLLIACSGGGDSTALLLLARDAIGVERICAGSINHNLRPEARDELAGLAQLCQSLGVAHQVRDWHWDGRGNLQAAARAGRRRLLAEIADDFGADTVLLGHTADDQAETLLMRLARGSGVDGLGGMAARDGRFLRPLLSATRSQLRDFLAGRGVDWSDDPSNEDMRFDRVRARAMADTLRDLGLDRARLLKTGALMRAEAKALRYGLQLWANSAVSETAGMLEVDQARFAAAPEALQSRFLAQAVRWFSGAAYKPRRDEVLTWHHRIAGGKPAPLGGVLAQARPGAPLRLWREAAALSGPLALLPHTVSTRWDHRWAISVPQLGDTGLSVAALGPEGLAACPDWRATGLPRAALETSPAIWSGPHLIAAPVLSFGTDWTATLRPSFAEFLDTH